MKFTRFSCDLATFSSLVVCLYLSLSLSRSLYLPMNCANINHLLEQAGLCTLASPGEGSQTVNWDLFSVFVFGELGKQLYVLTSYDCIKVPLDTCGLFRLKLQHSMPIMRGTKLWEARNLNNYLKLSNKYNICYIWCTFFVLRRHSNCFVYKLKFLRILKRTVSVLYNGDKLNNIQQREKLRKYLCCIAWALSWINIYTAMKFYHSQLFFIGNTY